MVEPAQPSKIPTWLSTHVDPDVAEIVHRTAYETGRSKRSLVEEAVRLIDRTVWHPIST